MGFLLILHYKESDRLLLPEFIVQELVYQKNAATLKCFYNDISYCIRQKMTKIKEYMTLIIPYFRGAIIRRENYEIILFSQNTQYEL